jgi:hypothetical protein
VLIPILYLMGISTGDFEEALIALLGKDAGGLSASTIGRLKEVWSDEHNVGASAISRPTATFPSDHLVPLIYPGSKTPLFCFHGEDGRLGAYVHLVRHLKRDRPVYGLRLGSFEAELDANLTLENLGSCYVAEIRKAQPTGPYWVCGYSFGGLVAFEVARHLIAQGAEVYLILLDAFPMSKWRSILFWLSVLLGRIREKTFLSSLQRRRERNWRPNHVLDTGYDGTRASSDS